MRVQGSPIWISHRGYKERHPENTLEAFRAARALGFRHLETDLRPTADGHIVLFHDPDLKRLFGSERNVASMTRSELEALRFPGGERLAFFDEFAEEFADLSWTLDIKPEDGKRTAELLERWADTPARRQRLAQSTHFLAWRREVESRLAKAFPSASFYANKRECWRAGLCVMLGMPWLGGIVKGRTYAVPPRLGRHSLFKEKYFARYQRAGAKVIAFLPETDADTHAAIAAGADEILTNGHILP